MNTFACLAPNTVIAAAIAPDRLSAFCDAVLGLPALATPPGLGNYVVLLTLTLVFEAPVYLLLGRYAHRSPRHSAIMLLGANVATHPAVIYALPPLAAAARLDLGAMTLMQEVFAVTVEAAVLAAAWRLPIVSALVGSVVANTASWWLGVLALTQAFSSDL